MRLPCPRCSEPIDRRSWEMTPHGDRAVIIHEDGRVCVPLDVDEEHELVCSCGATVRFRVIALHGAVRGGVTDRVACVCGVGWKLEPRTTKGMNVYVA